MSVLLGADFREVINGRVCVDGVLYSHPDLVEGQTVMIWYGGFSPLAEPLDARSLLDCLVLEEVQS